MCPACRRRLVRALERSLRESLARTDELIRGAQRSNDDARFAARFSRESLVVFRSRWT
jgi:hypothetical protein